MFGAIRNSSILRLSRLNRGMLSNFKWERSAKHVKFVEECIYVQRIIF